jgi:hypothetical protein
VESEHDRKRRSWRRYAQVMLSGRGGEWRGAPLRISPSALMAMRTLSASSWMERLGKGSSCVAADIMARKG